MKVWFAVVFISLLGACSASPEAGETNPQRVYVSPQDFALLPCPAVSVGASCAVVAAGGKRILLGAPEGAISAFTPAELAVIDAVMLFSLRAEEVEGLDTVRNASWRAGRVRPLLVFGPAGTETLIDGLNTAFQTTDALTYVENAPPGGFKSVLLAARSPQGGATEAFNTGDLRLVAYRSGATSLAFDIDYNGRVHRVGACGEKGARNHTRACSAAWPRVPYFLEPTLR